MGNLLLTHLLSQKYMLGLVCFLFLRFVYLFILLLLLFFFFAALRPYCCRLSLVAENRSYFGVAVLWLLIEAAFLTVGHRLQVVWASAVVAHGLGSYDSRA